MQSQERTCATTTNANCSNLAAIETWQVEKNAACMPSGFKDGLATQTWIVIEDLFRFCYVTNENHSSESRRVRSFHKTGTDRIVSCGDDVMELPLDPVVST